MKPYYQDEYVTVHAGDCLDVMRELPSESVDAVVTDPPYGLEFMGKDWDRPWAVTASAAVGFEGRENNLTLPSHRDNRNANCRACGGRQRGAKRCVCVTPDWDRSPASDMLEFQLWCQEWATECLRLLKPGGHLLAFGGTRTHHRLACAIEDAGFEIRDSIAWLYGSGFPKSLDVSKAIDKAAGAERAVVGRYESPEGTTGVNSRNDDYGFGVGDMSRRLITAAATDAAKQWQGWGTALKPAFEPIVVARKPIRGTVAANVTEHGTGALNIDATRVGTTKDVPSSPSRHNAIYGDLSKCDGTSGGFNPNVGRWPTNVVIDEDTAKAIDKDSGVLNVGGKQHTVGNGIGRPDTASGIRSTGVVASAYADTGGASRFFPTFKYQAKAPTHERPNVDGMAHATVKPLDLMRWLVRLVTPPNGVVLDPFAGSGTTAEACVHEYKQCIAIEREPDYLPLIVARLSKPMAVGFDFGEPA